MKKFFSIVIIVIMLVGVLAACDSAGKAKSDVLKVGIDLKYPPFMYLDENDEPAGLEPDLARAFGEYLGREVKIINTDFSMLIASLESGETDIVISDMSINEERKQKVDFSDGYRYGKTATLVNKEFYEANGISDDMPVEEFFALDGLKAIGLSGTISTIVPYNYGAEATEATEIATAIMEVTTGNYNVLVGSYMVFGDHAANPDTTEIYLGVPEYSTSAFAVKKGNTDLLEQANTFIASLYEDGGLYEQLADKYDAAVGEVFFNNSFGLDYIVTRPE